MGNYAYLSPETLKGDLNEPKSDVWSIGAILFTLLSGEAPFVGLDEDQLKAQILKGAVVFRCNNTEKLTYIESWWGFRTPAAKAFIQRLLTVDVAHRPTCLEALQDPWLQGTHKEDSIKPA